MPVWLRGFANLLDQAGISLCGNGFAYIFYISHRQHPGVIRSAAVAYAGFFVIWSTGYKIRFPNRTRLLSALLPSGSEFPVRFHCSPRADGEFRNSQDNAASTKPVNSRKGFYLDDIVGTFGVPVEEHRKESEVKQMDGYVSMGILTGKIAPEAGKD